MDHDIAEVREAHPHRGSSATSVEVLIESSVPRGELWHQWRKLPCSSDRNILYTVIIADQLLCQARRRIFQRAFDIDRFVDGTRSSARMAADGATSEHAA